MRTNLAVPFADKDAAKSWNGEMTSQAIGLYPDRHKSRQISELMRLRASDLRELAEKMRVVLAYDPAMVIRANEIVCAADAIDEWARGLR